MGRALVLIASAALVLAACTPAPTTAISPVPQKTGDFKQSKLDIAYSFMSDASVHKPTAKQLLTGALDAMKKEAKTSGGSDDGPPGLRPNYHPDYYGAFVRDPDGNRIEAVTHQREDQK